MKTRKEFSGTLRYWSTSDKEYVDNHGMIELRAVDNDLCTGLLVV